jgi:hypothetical protein
MRPAVTHVLAIAVTHVLANVLPMSWPFVLPMSWHRTGASPHQSRVLFGLKDGLLTGFRVRYGLAENFDLPEKEPKTQGCQKP